jgi:hypothetical protein
LLEVVRTDRDDTLVDLGTSPARWRAVGVDRAIVTDGPAIASLADVLPLIGNARGGVPESDAV